jgi:hypothetical protein
MYLSFIALRVKKGKGKRKKGKGFKPNLPICGARFLQKRKNTLPQQAGLLRAESQTPGAHDEP